MSQFGNETGIKMDKITVLIDDDHAAVREGTRQTPEQQPDIEVLVSAEMPNSSFKTSMVLGSAGIEPATNRL